MCWLPSTRNTGTFRSAKLCKAQWSFTLVASGKRWRLKKVKCANPRVVLFALLRPTDKSHRSNSAIDTACGDGSREGGRRRRPSCRSTAPAAPLIGSSGGDRQGSRDRKSTRLNSSHLVISYA